MPLVTNAAPLALTALLPDSARADGGSVDQTSAIGCLERSLLDERLAIVSVQ
jgi:hypothetical protein